MSRTRLQQSQQNIHHRAFASAGGTHDPHGSSYRDLQIRVIEDQTLCVGIRIRNILHLNAVLYIQLLLFIGSKGHVNILSVDLILQIIADSHEEGFKIGNGVDLIVDTVDTGQ